MDKRPILNREINVEDFRDFYWYKEELIAFCRNENLDKRGGKIELANRIEKYLKTGEKESHQNSATKTLSNFDWNSVDLKVKTIITDNYKNTENVRAFFKEQVGDRFKFNVKFMNWMKTAQGNTLGDAVAKWLEITSEMKTDNSPKEIAPQFEYNTYIRDFLKDNPTKDRNEAIVCWKIKKLLRGDNKYRKTDLGLIGK
jgi:hypothetical protein